MNAVRGRAVGRAHLAQPRAGAGQQVGQPEAVADLDELPPAHHDLGGFRAGQSRRGQDQGGGVVVDHGHRLGVRNGAGQGVKRAGAAAGPHARGQVELDVAAARGRGDRVHGRRG